MKRGVLFALLAMLALLLAPGATALATPDGVAEASKGKKKKCKSKGKAKGKNRAAASAKKKGCKKKTGKKPAGSPKEEGTVPQPGAPGGTWPPADGKYVDSGPGITLTLSGGASTATLQLSSDAFCIPFIYSTKPQPTVVTSSSLSSGGEDIETPAGGNLTVKWKIEVASSLQYSLTVDSKSSGGPFSDCDKPGVVVKGTFVKSG